MIVFTTVGMVMLTTIGMVMLTIISFCDWVQLMLYNHSIEKVKEVNGQKWLHC
jgi:hypothetical protein